MGVRRRALIMKAELRVLPMSVSLCRICKARSIRSVLSPYVVLTKATHRVHCSCTCQAVSCVLPSSCPALPSHHISTRHPFQFPSVVFWHFALFSVRYGTPHQRLKPQSPFTPPPCSTHYSLLVSLSASSSRGLFVMSFPPSSPGP